MKTTVILLLIAVCMLSLLLIGCEYEPKGTARALRYYQDIAPNVVEVGNTDDDGYFYLVDKNTGVVYLGFTEYRKSSLTVMLNADGSPVMAEDLGIKYE